MLSSGVDEYRAKALGNRRNWGPVSVSGALLVALSVELPTNQLPLPKTLGFVMFIRELGTRNWSVLQLHA
jgi:hypothetical protein